MRYNLTRLGQRLQHQQRMCVLPTAPFLAVSSFLPLLLLGIPFRRPFRLVLRLP